MNSAMAMETMKSLIKDEERMLAYFSRHPNERPDGSFFYQAWKRGYDACAQEAKKKPKKVTK